MAVPCGYAVEELTRLVSSTWRWNVQSTGNNTFRVPFPSKEDVHRMVEWGVVHTKFGPTMKIEETAGGNEVKYVMPKVWVQFIGLPKDLREFLVIWAIGSILGVSKMVDMKFTRLHHVMVLDPNLIPQFVDVVIGDYLYELQFRVEHNMDDNNPEPMDMDTGNGKDEQPKEDTEERDKLKQDQLHGATNNDQDKGMKDSGVTNNTAPTRQAASRTTTSAHPVFHLKLPGFSSRPQGHAPEMQLSEANSMPQEVLPMSTQTEPLQQQKSTAVPTLIQQVAPPLLESEVTSVQDETRGSVEPGVVHENNEQIEDEQEDESMIPHMTESELSAELKAIAAQWSPDVSSMAAIPEAATGSSMSRRSKRRAESVDEDSALRAETLKACRNLEVDFTEGTVLEEHTGFPSGCIYRRQTKPKTNKGGMLMARDVDNADLRTPWIEIYE